MTKRQELVKLIEKTQQQLSLLDSAPEDTYHFDTIALFVAPSGKWHYRKVGEESWIKLGGNPEIKTLAEWFLHSVESGIGNFEIYILTVPETPVYASA